MFGDIICEQLVKRKLGPVQMLKVAGVLVGGLLVSYLLYVVGAIADVAVGLMASMFFLCGIALTIFFVRYVIFVEYEYSFVNGELTIDKILAKSKRKHLKDIDVKSFEKMGKYDPEAVSKIKASVVCDYSIDKLHPDSMYAYFKDDETGRNTVLIFTPNQKLIDSMKNYVSATVYREAFSKTKK